MVFNFKDEIFPERDYKDYSMGLGLSTHLLRIKNINISFSASISRILSHDRSVYQHDKIQDDYSFMIQTERTFIIKNQKIKPFFGPVYVKNILYDYNDFYTEVKGKSVRNFGFASGVNIILFNHIDCFSHIVYVNYFQPRFGIGYIF